MSIDTVVLNGASWLLTYAVHSSLLLAMAWVVTRTLRMSYAAQEILWKTAMVGGIATGALHVATGGGLAPSFAIGTHAANIAPQVVVDTPREATPPLRWDLEGSRLASNVNGPAEDRELVAARMPLDPIGPTSEAESSEAAGMVVSPMGPSSPTLGARMAAVAQRVTWPLALSVLWLIGVVTAVVRFVRARVRLAALLRDRRPVYDPFLLEELDRLRAEAGVTHGVRLSWSPHLVAPVALRREVCIPKRALTDLEPELRSGMLAHELAHVARQDSTWLHVTFALRLAMFFQPLNRLAYRRLQELAEYLCDEWAVRHTGRRRAVAECLAEVAHWIDRSGRPIPLPSMAYDGSNLVHRVERILSGREDRHMLPRSLKLLSVAAAVGAFAAAAPGFAPQRDGPAAPAADVVGAEIAVRQDPVPTPPQPPVPTTTEPRSVQPAPAPPARIGAGAPIESLGRTVAPMAAGVSIESEVTVAPPIPDADGAIEAVQDTVDPRVVASLLNVLRDEEPEVRREAAEALGRLRAPAAVPGLITALGDEATPVRAYAAWGLGRIKDMRALDPVLNAMVNDDSARVRRAAANAVDNIISGRDRSSIDVTRLGAAFAQLLTDPDPELRSAGIEALTDLRLAQFGPRMVPLMTDENPSVRRQAAAALGRFQTAGGLAPLTAALADTSASVRRSALSAIARYDSPEGTAAVRRGLQDESEDVRESAARLIGQRKDTTAFDALVASASDPSADVRVASLRALRELRLPRATSAYTRALDDPSQSVRTQGVAGLGELRDPVALPALTRAAGDSVSDVREIAIRSLHRLGDTIATPVLVRALSDPSADVRIYAARALGDIRTTRSFPVLRIALRDSVAEVREYAVRSLSKYKEATALDAFIEALDDSHDDVREYAAQALGGLKDPRGVAPLSARLRTEQSTDVRKRIIRSLGNIGGETVVPPIIAALGDGSSEVRALAVGVLGQLRDPRAVDGLVRALDDENSEVRRAATRALGRIRGR